MKRDQFFKCGLIILLMGLTYAMSVQRETNALYAAGPAFKSAAYQHNGEKVVQHKLLRAQQGLERKNGDNVPNTKAVLNLDFNDMARITNGKPDRKMKYAVLTGYLIGSLLVRKGLPGIMAKGGFTSAIF